MSCCGKRRDEWMRREKVISSSENSIPSSDSSDKSRTHSLFEYIGSRSLQVRGSITGSVYNFRFHGHRLIVHGNDSWGLMAESELKYIGKAEKF